ncbi:hypothetical protein DI09_46p90 [Mitosporidium daphniae]|uniref:YMC020W-like alpha/beta hydrolase domain-containing protein n=1 Tax=Mitosporidium daphniae TaxID=1485682 RepID=A0A098VQG8_9MICR|nr:uncharacterized protein DI09_46p90 [Mitosporidium daphniae]KGG51059.1 hypothetical protein DI09_46p90 [Mitosporidium daphniae]|eukprot:XP_013237505.1 uncharacterized protein DI09_46p90 [Mitosporidium daphniae]
MERVEAFVQNSALKEALERSTDLIVVAHSQGVPVGTLLLERLHAEGALTGVQNITLVAMAGKNILIQYMETESSRELFELHAPFMVPSVTGSDDSQVPKIVSKSPATEMAARLRAALLRLLHAGVRVIAVGSWMDQLVPLYSSTLYGLFHPNITRLLYIEGSGVAHHHSTQSHGHDHVKEIQERDSFLPLLLTLCLSIKNAGFSDHGLLVYLSEWIAGSIVNGDNGHSSIYADPLVYESAAQIIGHSLCSKMEAPRYVPFEVPEEPNHYHVPWMMHALVTDSKLLAVPIIRQEIDAMVLAYACWRPRSKALRDLKRKLAALGTYGRASL